MNSHDLRNRLWIILVEPEGKINFGFILRLARNYGIAGIYVVNPKFNIHDNEVKEFASRGVEYLNKGRVIVRESLFECLSEFDFIICTTAKGGSESDLLRQSVHIDALPYLIPEQGKIALVFGRESVGLTREELSLCNIITTLDTGTDYNVLNLSHAVAIYLHILLSLSMKRFMLGISCDPRVIRIIDELAKYVCEKLELPEVHIVLRHILSRASLRKCECSALYKFFKRLKYLLK